jgi:DNA primase
VDVVALFDPDEAGRKALDRSLELFLGMSMRAKALVLPGGYDPDDYVKKFGKDKLEELIADAQPLSDYYIENVLGGGKTFEEKREKVKTAIEFLNKINDKKEKDLFIKRIAEKTGLDQELLIQEVYNKERKKQQASGQKQNQKIHIDPVEVNLIRLLLEYPQKTVQVESENILDYFLQSELKALGGKIIETYKLLGFVDIGVILPTDEDTPLREKIFQLMMEALPADGVMVDKIFIDNIRQIQKKWYKDQHQQIKLKLGKAQEKGNEELLNQLLQEKKNLISKEREVR